MSDNMKNPLILLLVSLMLCTSCSPTLFQQIATLSSDNVEVKEDGTFAYQDAMVTIEYDFWSEAGKFNFIVTNNTDENLYLNLGESYFVNNGNAYDYYQARTYVYENRPNPGAPDKVSKVEYAEKPVICIPARASKAIKEFKVTSSAYRECDFVRDPSKRETAVKVYTEVTSPRIVENRLVFQIGDVKLPVTNVFYVSEYRNIAAENAIEYHKVNECNGAVRYVRVNKFSADNKFFITYDLWSPEGTSNDRIEGRNS